MNFKGKTALVTGAAVGIGRAAALVFAERGANLVLVDMNYEKLKDVKKRDRKARRGYAYIPMRCKR